MRFIEVAETGDTDVDVFEGKVAWIGEAKLDFSRDKEENRREWIKSRINMEGTRRRGR